MSIESLRKQIAEFVPHPKYRTKYQSPHYRRLVMLLSQMLAKADAKAEHEQAVRDKWFGDLNTGGKGGFAPVAPEALGGPIGESP